MQCQQVWGCWILGRGQARCGWCLGRVSPVLLTQSWLWAGLGQEVKGGGNQSNIDPEDSWEMH